ncbi:hypothetical protein Droror1_Dr00016834 [Drosera rotundifolia]
MEYRLGSVAESLLFDAGFVPSATEVCFRSAAADFVWRSHDVSEPEKHVFHLVTDKLNFGAMNMWFLLNPPGKATIHVENVDGFKWLNSSYCPVLWQLESAGSSDYFKADHPTTAGSSNLKYRNPKYLSMLNHLRSTFLKFIPN